MKKIFKVLFVIFLTVMFLLVIAAIGAAFLASSMIDEKQAQRSPRIPDNASLMSAMEKSQIQKCMMDAFSGAPVKEDAQTVVELNENEVNALLDSMLIMIEARSDTRKGETEQGKLVDFYFKDGKYFILASRDLKMKTPFGSFINIMITAIPDITNHKFTVQIKSFAIGTMNLPIEWINDKLKNELAILDQNENAQLVLDIISEMKVENGKTTITYSPKKVLTLITEKGLLNKMGSMMGGGDAGQE